MTDQALPHNLDAERAVLAAMLMDREALATGFEILDEGPRVFYAASHQAIFEALRECESEGETCDLTTLSERLRQAGRLDKVGGLTALAGLLQTVSTSANVEHHAEIVREKFQMREMLKTFMGATERGLRNGIKPAELMAHVEHRLLPLQVEKRAAGFEPFSEVLSRTMDELSGSEGPLGGGLPYGLNRLDIMTGGMHKGDMIVLAARPSMGKTSLAVQIGLQTARKGIGVGIISMEMNDTQIMKRVLCAEARIHFHRLTTGQLSKDEYKRLAAAGSKINELPIWICDDCSASIHSLRSRAKRLQLASGNVGLIVLDYIGLVEAGIRSENRQNEVSYISKSIKQLARDLNVPVLALSQMSRAIEKRQDPTPLLSDLRDSGSLEQDADVVLFIHAQKRKEGPNGKVRLIVAKQRNGPVGGVDLVFDGPAMRFEEAAPDGMEAPPASSGGFDESWTEGLPF